MVPPPVGTEEQREAEHHAEKMLPQCLLLATAREAGKGVLALSTWSLL